MAITACASSGGRTASRVDPRAELRAAIDSMVSLPKFRSAQWGILIVDPDAHDTLYSRNAGKLFMPASNQKLLSGSVALALLGPDFRYRTSFSATGPIDSGTLRGNLLVTGRGDPTISDRMRQDAMAPLRAIADSLGIRGVRRISGRLLRDGDAFPDATLGFGWAWDDLDFPYSAGVDELYFNEGFTRVIVRGATQAGAPATARTTPALRSPPLRVEARTTVTREEARRAGGLTVLNDSAGSGVIVRGAVGAGDSAVLTIAHRDPGAAYLAALREALEDRGIIIEDSIVGSGVVAARSGGDGPAIGSLGGGSPAPLHLFAIESPPLRTILPAFEKPSQNQIGEILLKTLGLERKGVGSADSGRAVIRDQLLAWGAQRDGFVVRDGSGLSRHNVVTPETIVRVLYAMRGDTAFKVFYDALPIAGIDGTIAARMRGTRAEGNVRAKTGFIDLARSLSGYVTTADGRMLLFSMLANNWTTSVREIEQVQDAIAVRLAELRLRPR